MFDAISQDTQRQSLSGRDGLSFCGPVRHYTRNIYNLGNPAPVSLKFCFDLVHDMRHVCILTRGQHRGIKVWLDFPNITRRI